MASALKEKLVSLRYVYQLEINIVYILKTMERKTSQYGDYYYCKGYCKDTGEKIRIRSNYYLKQEIEIYESLKLDRDFAFKVTKVRPGEFGTVASVQPMY